MLNAPAAVEEQLYHSDEIFFERDRRLQDNENYNSTFVPLRDLHAWGLSANIRIKSVWDPVDNGDVFHSKTYECSFVGQTITVQDANNNEVLAPSFCQAKHIVTGVVGAARGNIMRARTEYVSPTLTRTRK
jgi:hypothetical protein